MDRGGSLRFLLLGIAGVFLFLSMQKWMKGDSVEHQPIGGETHLVAPTRAPEQTCDLWSDVSHARIRSHGGALTHYQLLTAKYRKKGEPLDISTTPDPGDEHEFRQQLFTRLRGEGPEPPNAPWNVKYDSVDYALTRADGKECDFSYKDADVVLEKTIRETGRPYELEVRTKITNVASRPMSHALSLDTVAWRTSHEVEGKMFRISPYVTHVECMPNEGKAVRLLPADFDPAKFKDEAFAPSASNPRGEWHRVPGAPAFAAVSNAYFSHAIAPVSGPAAPECLLLVEQRWDSAHHAHASEDPGAGAMYRARLAYPEKTLAPNESAEYVALSYIGPKERDILATAGGGQHRLIELIDLGFFALIAKVLVAFLLKVHSVIPNWGVAIIVLTVTARVLLFPLSLPGLKNTIRMREIKPEMDALNEKYKDDPQQRGLAQMELWRKHNVNPFKGCVPQLASMPVWFALYTTLQTAVELYNIPFLWFPDLSQSDPMFILPFVIGGTYFVQQRMMPQQGGDPVQQKMMMYMMPGMFTVFMLFLPAGLGVYMFTNSVLAITQQWSVERFARKAQAGSGNISVKVKGEGEKALPPKSEKKDSKRAGAS
ncbi:MAG TPA: membrane protein insertase YidC [Polyangiaceae bacterium]|nr:membrane protein insertase YidC [Polyangiaceae bacterium]